LWLRTDENESADRVLDAVLDRLDTTPQRRATWWPTWRYNEMNLIQRLGVTTVAAALVLALAYVVLVRPNVGQQTEPTPSPSATASDPGAGAAASSEAPSEEPARFAPAGQLEAGERYDLTLDGVPATIAVPTSKWGSNGQFLLWVVAGEYAGEYFERAHMFFWPELSPAGVFADPCAGEASPPAGPTAADLAAAIAALPGTELLSGPSDVTIDGRAGKFVEILVPADIPCSPGTFLLWYYLGCPTEAECARYASWKDSIIRVWVIELDDGARAVVEAERIAGGNPAIDQEVDDIVNSIDFE
jgi:hypothetical protein